jgi:ribosomal protein S12 methylthiotransferase
MEVRDERRERFMLAQAKISTARLKAKVGRTLRVLVDETDRKGAIARSAADAPEIDGVVRILDGAKLKPGEFADVRIEKSDAHDLFGRLA